MIATEDKRSLKELAEEYYQSAERLKKQIHHFYTANKNGEYDNLIRVLREERYDALYIAQYLEMRNKNEKLSP